MKASNFKITICGLNHYLSVHCVLFVLFLHPLCCCLMKFESMSYIYDTLSVLSGTLAFGCMWQHGIFFMIMSLLILTLLGISSHVFLAFNNAIAIYIHVDGG